MLQQLSIEILTEFEFSSLYPTFGYIVSAMISVDLLLGMVNPIFTVCPRLTLFSPQVPAPGLVYLYCQLSNN